MPLTIQLLPETKDTALDSLDILTLFYLSNVYVLTFEL